MKYNEVMTEAGWDGNAIFFFKQKTAFEVLSGFVGSEKCIRDRPTPSAGLGVQVKRSKIEGGKGTRSVPYTNLTLRTKPLG